MKKRIFRDYQEETADDHNAAQDYIYEQLDDVTADTVSAAKKFAGLMVQKTGQVEVTVAPGRVYDGGVVFKRRTSLPQSMSQYTAAAAKRIVAIHAYGNTNNTDETERDVLVDVDNNTVEPQQVSLSTSRDVQLVFLPGAEAVDPVPPPIPATSVAIAYVTMDTSQVLSVQMLIDNQVASTDGLDVRTKTLENWRIRTDPRVSSLASDLASLQSELKSRADLSFLNQVFLDLARVKAALRFPDDASDYGSDYYLDQSKSDMTDAAMLGFDARVEMGIRFNNANASQFELSLFSANDPNAKLTGGVLLPAYTEEVKISTGNYASELGISQYGYQTFNMQTGYLSRSRIRYGGYYVSCVNGMQYSVAGEPANASNLYDFKEALYNTAVSYSNLDAPGHETTKTDYWWYDTWKEPFSYLATVDHVITGAQVAQSFLVSNDIWATKLGFYITSKGANEDIHLALCELTGGTPDLSKCLLKTTYPAASIAAGGWNYAPITPTFLQKGKRYALVLVSNANHKVGMADGQGYLDGTFFYSTDTLYYQGDLTKDMMLQIVGAKFNASSVTVEFNAINLDGGFRDIDILAGQWVPESCQLFYEIQPNGTGEWIPISRENPNILDNAPPLARFRARFVGTRDMAPAIQLSGSRVLVFRPKTTFRHVSKEFSLNGNHNNLTVVTTMEGFNETPHDCGLRMYIGGGYYTPTSTITETQDAARGRVKRTYSFTGLPTYQKFRMVFDGTTTSPVRTFQVSETDYFAR